QLRRQMARPDVDPGVLVHKPAKELAAVGALLADDLGALDQRGVVDQERAPLAAGDVLGLVEAESRQRAQRTQWAAAVGAEETVGVVLDQVRFGTAADLDELVHLARHAGVVHDGHRPRARRNAGLDRRAIQAELRQQVQLAAGDADPVEGNARRGQAVTSSRTRPSTDSRTTACGRCMLRKWMRARYSPMMPSAKSSAPAKVTTTEARKEKPGTVCP